MKFDLEKYLICWKLRDIVVLEDQQIAGCLGPAYRTRLDNGKRVITVIYIKKNVNDVFEYDLMLVEIIQENSPHYTRKVLSKRGKRALESLETI